MSRGMDPGHFFQTNDSIENRNRQEKKAKNKHGNPVQLNSKLLAVLPAGPASVFVAEAAGRVRVVDVRTSRIEATYEGATAPLTSLAYSKSTQTVFAGCWDKSIHSWHTITRKPLRRYTGHADFVKCVDTTQLGETPILVSGSADGTIIAWDINTGKKLHIIKAHNRGVLDLRIDPVGWDAGNNSAVLFSADSTREIKRWQLDTTSYKAIGDPIVAHETSVNRLCFDPKDPTDEGTEDEYNLDMWSASDDKTAQHLVRSNGFKSDMTLEHPDYVRDLICTPDGQSVVTACRDENVRIWSSHTGELQMTYEGHYDEVTGLAVLLLEGRYTLVSVSIDGTVRSWSLDSAQMLAHRNKATEKAEDPNAYASDDEPKKQPLLSAEEEAELQSLMES